VRTFSALGAGGQQVMVVPALDLVIAHYAGSYSSNGWRLISSTVAPTFSLPAVH
jgi:predicted cupin superfamily sugar epimerase